MRHTIRKGRLWAILAGILLLLGGIGWRVFDIAFLRHDWYAQTAKSQASGASNVLVRGNIFLADGKGGDFLVATNRQFAFVTVAPGSIASSSAGGLATALSGILNMDPVAIATTLTGGTSNRILARRLSDTQVDAIKALKIPGISIGYENDRAYPAGSLASNLIGFLGYDSDGQRAGQYGVEAAYDSQLAGNEPRSAGAASGIIGHLSSLVGRSSDTGPDTSVHPLDVELTIDKNIQTYAEGSLTAVLRKYHAASGMVVIQDPTTGAIMAMVSSPSFNPNDYSDFPVASFANEALAPFEPGSSFKPMVMSMGLDLKKVTPTSTYNDNHDIVVDGYPINNFNNGHFGLVTMSQILEKSINTGMIYVQSLIAHDQFLRYVTDLGFGQKSGIDLPGEAAGSVDNLYSNRPINFMTASFGQGITVTPVQMVTAYSAIANGGKIMKPYVVAALHDPDTDARVVTQPEVEGTPFSAGTAAMLRTMLVSVVDIGFDKARIAHYDVAGKTGTAQIASPNGGYIESQYNHSFAGFAPASNPKFTIFIRMEKPQGITFAADSLSPTFRDIALFLLNYLNIPPTR